MITFGVAFNKLRTRCMQKNDEAAKIYRESWGGGRYIKMYLPCLHANDGLPLKNAFLYEWTRDGSSAYLPTNEDLFARDWELMECDE